MPIRRERAISVAPRSSMTRAGAAACCVVFPPEGHSTTRRRERVKRKKPAEAGLKWEPSRVGDLSVYEQGVAQFRDPKGQSRPECRHLGECCRFPQIRLLRQSPSTKKGLRAAR